MCYFHDSFLNPPFCVVYWRCILAYILPFICLLLFNSPHAGSSVVAVAATKDGITLTAMRSSPVLLFRSYGKLIIMMSLSQFISTRKYCITSASPKLVVVFIVKEVCRSQEQTLNKVLRVLSICVLSICTPNNGFIRTSEIAPKNIASVVKCRYLVYIDVAELGTGCLPTSRTSYSGVDMISLALVEGVL